MKGWFGELDYKEPAIIKELNMQHLPGTFLLIANRKDSNGSQFQKTPTSPKIYTRLSGTFTALRQNLNLLRPSHRTGPTKIDLKTLKEI